MGSLRVYGARASTASSTTFGGSARGDGGCAISKRRSCRHGSSIPGRTILFSSKLLGERIGRGAGGGRGGVDSLETSRVALGGVFECEVEAGCASVILECCLPGTRPAAKSDASKPKCRPELLFGQALLADEGSRRRRSAFEMARPGASTRAGSFDGAMWHRFLC